MRGPLAELVEERAIGSVIGSVWAEVGWRLGWLPLDGLVDRSAWEASAGRLRAAAEAGEIRGAAALAMLAAVSVRGSSWLALVADDGRWLHVDLDTWAPPGDEHSEGRSLAIDDAQVRHVRLPARSFADGLLIPAGPTARRR